MAWTTEKKQECIEAYKKAMAEYATDELRAQHTTEVVADLAEEFGETVNGVRTILARAEVYYKKAPATKAATAKATATGEGTKRINKADAIAELTNTIAAIDPDLVDEEVLSKLTGKAAAYFVSILIKAGN